MKHRKDWFSHQKRHTVILKRMHWWLPSSPPSEQGEVGEEEGLNLEAELQANNSRQAGSGQPADGVECALRGDL